MIMVQEEYGDVMGEPLFDITPYRDLLEHVCQRKIQLCKKIYMVNNPNSVHTVCLKPNNPRYNTSKLNPSTPLLNSAVDPLLYNPKCLLGTIMKIHRMTRIRHYMGCKVGRSGEEITIRIKDILRTVISRNVLMAISSTCPTIQMNRCSSCINKYIGLFFNERKNCENVLISVACDNKYWF